MSLPTTNDVQAVETVLTNMLVSYQQNAANFVATRAFPVVNVGADSGTYFIFDQKYWMLEGMKERAAGADYPVGEYGVSTSTYSTLQYALGYRIADETRANSQVPMDLESAAVQWLAQQSLIRKERSWAAQWMLTSVWGAADGTIGNKWSDYANSDPVANIMTGKRTISQATGYQANTIIMGEIVRDRAINHPDLLDRIKYVQAANLGNIDAALSAIFGMNVIVGSAIYNTANEAQTASYSPIIDDDILILYVEPQPRILSASAGYTFAWPGGGGAGVVMRNRLDANDADLIKSKEQWDFCQVASYLGYIYLDATD